MNNYNKYTVIYFEYGGSYTKNEDGESFRWIFSRETPLYALLIKKPMEEVTYSELVKNIYRKTKIDEATTKLKLSYIPMLVEPKRPSYILDDEDVLGFLLDIDKDLRKNVLHVQRTEVDVPSSCSRVEGSNPSRIQDVVYKPSSGNDAIITNIVAPSQHYEFLDNVFDIAHGEEAAAAIVDNDDISGDVELIPDVVEADHGWEDGIDLTIGQEFGNKQEVQDLVDKASVRNCFDVATIKSCSLLYLLKCRQAKYGCKWYLRASKVKNSGCFLVRGHNKIHTCARVKTGTSRNRRKCSPQLVASFLHEYYPGQLRTLTPKIIVGLVQEKLGITVSYTTALRGKKQAANNVQALAEEPK
ncbi:uncharacterized protein LOC112083525 [Eutrema salsugineum]|uniref:uncharacterized protein LOC112083525 n=1 Tax=Eutrema salsugineum TaxID=72664 RepID=UPI000CECF142|nr:uncharacterized protein LOC112083525 [Eutrema salsugineum]